MMDAARLSEGFVRSRYHSYSSMRKKRGLPHVTFAQYRAFKTSRAGRPSADLRLRDEPPRVVAADAGPREILRRAIAECDTRPWSYSTWARKRMAASAELRAAAVRAVWESIVDMEDGAK